MPPPDLLGRLFGHLTVVRFSYLSERDHGYWICRCKCGNIKELRDTMLTGGRFRSCGCQANYRTHGMTGTRIAKTHDSMMSRCYNKNDPSYAGYGGRGITVCKRWHKFENFVVDMGIRPPNRTLDRKNNNKGYSKANCRWATRSEQQFNKRNHWTDNSVKPHGRPTKKLVGKVFGKLTVVERVYIKGRGNLWKCACECGGQALCLSYNLVSGNSRTCNNRKVHRPNRSF